MVDPSILLLKYIYFIVITDQSVSLNRLKTPIGKNGLTDLHCSIVDQY